MAQMSNSWTKIDGEFANIPSDEVRSVLKWLDGIPLSRAERRTGIPSLRRDFSDGVLAAEIIKHFFPRGFRDINFLDDEFTEEIGTDSDGTITVRKQKIAPVMVELHNYPSASKRAQKLTNWTTLNRKILTKLGFSIPKEMIDDIIDCKRNDSVLIFLSGLQMVNEDRLRNSNLTPKVSKIESQISFENDQVTRVTEMDIALLDADAKLVVSEKEKALLASYECIKVLELKIKRLENVLTQKEARLTELKKAAQYTKA